MQARLQVIEMVKWPRERLSDTHGTNIIATDLKSLDSVRYWLNKTQKPVNAIEEIAIKATAAFATDADDLEERFATATRFLKLCKKELKGHA
ncbi:MAG: hypothetical protein AABZ44_00365 [Elusimicrobiota bacterium]